MHPMLNIAVRAARAAGNVILRHMDRIDTLTVTSKRRNDFVSEVDHRAEQEIIRVLRKAYPDHTILAEESGEHTAATGEYQWIIDPLDGTTNYLHGFPQFAVSIALKHRDRIEQGVVYDPLREELFTATRGAGARLNDRRIRVSASRGLEGALVGTGFPFRDYSHLDTYLGVFREVVTEAAGVRRAGSAALDLAYVAAGRLDGFWEANLKAWDIAAGTLLILEAGGLATDFRGEHDFLERGELVCGPPKTHQALLALVQRHYAH
ncbi:MAG: inositol monophosphatase, partial [Gammaproteobacteria bacterium]|nr:inositol monophosphatase [Gammaproteobacteria bacterium]